MSSRLAVGAFTALTAVFSVFFKLVDHVRAIDFLAEVKSSSSFAALGSWFATPVGAAIVSAVIVGLFSAVAFLLRELRSKNDGRATPEEVVEEERTEEIHTKRIIRKVNKAKDREALAESRD